MIETPDFSAITSFVRNEARINIVSIFSFNQIKYYQRKITIKFAIFCNFLQFFAIFRDFIFHIILLIKWVIWLKLWFQYNSKLCHEWESKLWGFLVSIRSSLAKGKYNENNDFSRFFAIFRYLLHFKNSGGNAISAQIQTNFSVLAVYFGGST